MLSNPSQYSPQSLLPQFPGLQSAGPPQTSPGLFGQPGAYNGGAQPQHSGGAYNGYAPFGNAQFGAEFAQAGLSQQGPFGQQIPFGFGQQSSFGATTNPFLSSFAGHAGAHIPAHQIVPVLGQLAQHIAVQSAVAQQIGMAVHQLAHQLAVQGLQGYPGGGFGAGQAFAGGGQPYIGGGAQPFGLGAQGAYGGFNPQGQAWNPQGQAWGPQGQAWGARPQTIQ